jgi:hypothetical protein
MMTSRRRSNRIVLQEVIEESRKEAEEAVKSQQQQPLEDDDEDTSGGGRQKDRAGVAKTGEVRRGTSGSSRSAGDDDAGRETGRKRLRKLNDATSKKSHVSKKARTANGDDSDNDDEEDDDDVVVLSDGIGGADLENSDASSGDAGRGNARKASRSSSRGVARNSNSKRRPLSIHDDADSQDGSEGNDESDAEDDPVDRKRSQPTTTVNSKSSSSVSIPKKAIPRRKPDASSGQSPSSLLAHMKPAQPSVGPHFPQGSSRHPPSSKFKAPAGPTTSSQPTATATATATTKPYQDPYASASSTAPSQQRMSPKQDSTAESAGPAISKRFVPPKPAPSGAALSSNRASGTIPKQQVVDDLERLCHALGDDARFALPPMASIDLSGSFLGDDDRYAFFDTDQFGEIVFQPRVPIFPEEFPPGMAAHSLSWWGVLDPALGDGKFKAPVSRGADPHPSPPARGNSGGAGPGQAGLPQSQWNYPPPNLQAQRSGQPPQWATTSQPQPQSGMHPQGRGPNSWTPPRQGAAGSGGGGNPQPPPSNRRYTPPRNYDRR